MILTTAQLQTIKADIVANSDLNVHPNTPDGNSAIAHLYNLTASPTYWVYRTAVLKTDFTNSVGPDGTTFTFVDNGFITRSAGEQAAWRELFDQTGTTNPSLANVRQAFVDIFSGTGNAAANRTHMAAVARRQATRVEDLLATGAGTTASPSQLGAEGVITFDQVALARNS